MKKVIKYETIDGKTFSNQKNATIHINKIYSDKVTHLSLEAIKRMPDVRYQDMMEFIDDYLIHFEKLIEIRKDLELIDTIDED